MFDKIKYYYEMGFYKEKHLVKLLYVGAITEEEFKKIRGDIS